MRKSDKIPWSSGSPLDDVPLKVTMTRVTAARRKLDIPREALDFCFPPKEVDPKTVELFIPELNEWVAGEEALTRGLLVVGQGYRSRRIE